MQMTVDRIEGTIAVCEKEDGSFEDIEMSLLPAETKEGDVIEFNNGKWVYNKQATVERKQHIHNLMKDLWED